MSIPVNVISVYDPGFMVTSSTVNLDGLKPWGSSSVALALVRLTTSLLAITTCRFLLVDPG